MSPISETDNMKVVNQEINIALTVPNAILPSVVDGASNPIISDGGSDLKTEAKVSNPESKIEGINDDITEAIKELEIVKSAQSAQIKKTLSSSPDLADIYKYLEAGAITLSLENARRIKDTVDELIKDTPIPPGAVIAKSNDLFNQIANRF